MKADDIIVAGGGVVALSFALAAARRGWRVRIAHTGNGGGDAGGGRYYALGKRAADFLRAAEITPPSVPVHRFDLRAGGVYLPLSSPPAPLCRIVGEDDLLAALRARVKAARLPVAAGARVEWRQTSDAAAHIAVDDREFCAPLLAIAAGARAPITRQAGFFAAARDFRQRAVTAVVTTAMLPPHTAAQWFADNDVVALLPIPGGAGGGGRFCLIWSAAHPPAAEDLQARLAARIGLSDVRLAADIPPRDFPLRSMRRGARIGRRIALLGDAAQVIHPLAGQGLNLGLRDADCLRLCLRAKDPGDAAGLAAYAAATSARADILETFTARLARSGVFARLALSAGHLPGARRLCAYFANA